MFSNFFESFKENVNKNLEKLNENYNFLLLSILIAGWGLGCSSSFANLPGFGGGEFPLPPGYATAPIVRVASPMNALHIVRTTE